MQTNENQKPRRPIAGPGIPLGQREIAKAIGISRARVAVIEKRAIEKIRTALHIIATEEGMFDEQ